jgi:TrmH family RNA methyltransferase
MITSKQNQLIQQYRTDDDLVIVESAKLVHEALQANFIPKIALFTGKSKELHPDLFDKLSAVISDISVITPYLAEYISDTKSPQGIFVKFERKRHFHDFGQAKRVMILDNVQDPGNVGAILRSCEAFGFDCVVFSHDSTDIHNPKVVRASAGSAFRLPELCGKLCEIIRKLQLSGFTIWGAALDESAASLKEAAFGEKTAVVIGNEGRGISEEILNLCDNKLYIPIKGAQSLNASVAAGIICYEIGSRA